MAASYLPAILTPLVGIVFPAFSMALFFIYISEDDIIKKTNVKNLFFLFSSFLSITNKFISNDYLQDLLEHYNS